MPLSAAQLRLIHAAARGAGLNEAQYRTVLRNVGGVESSKELDQAGFEDVLATFEDSGWRDNAHAPDHWRQTVAQRGVLCGTRMVWKIEQLAKQQKYGLAGLCRRVSDGRTEHVAKLKPREAANLIQLLEAVIERYGDADGAVVAPSEPSYGHRSL